jgi:hypothetical protein
MRKSGETNGEIIIAVLFFGVDMMTETKGLEILQIWSGEERIFMLMAHLSGT